MASPRRKKKTSASKTAPVINPWGPKAWKAMFRNGRMPLAALLFALSFPPFDLWPLIWVCLVPFLLYLDQLRESEPRGASDGKKVIWAAVKSDVAQALRMGFLMNLFAFYWVAYSLHRYGNLPWPAAILGFLIFGFLCQPQFILWVPLRRWILPLETRGTWGRGLFILLSALLYAGLDWAAPKLWKDTLGHAFYLADHFRQGADLGGAHLLTVAVVAVHETLRMVIRGLKDRNEPSLVPTYRALRVPLAGTLLWVGGLWAYGFSRAEEIRILQENPIKTINVGVIQANIGDFEKLAAESGLNTASDGILETYLRLSQEALATVPQPEVLVWPETAYPATFRVPLATEDLERDRKIEQFVRKTGVPLLFGGYDHYQKKDYNSFFFLTPRPGPAKAIHEFEESYSSDLQTYHKGILLMFGEYLPGADWFPVLKEAFPQVGNFGRGSGPDVFRLPTANGQELKFSPEICYEILFPEHAIAGVRKGGEILFNVTNDSWFGPVGEPHLHLALSVFRDIETRVPQVRATNTGFTALILPDGEMARKSALMEPEIFNVSVPVIAPVSTLMLRWGDWFGPTALVLGLLGTLGFLLATRRRK